MDIDLRRLRDTRYAHEVFTKLMADNKEAIRHFCIQRLGEYTGEEVASEVFVTAFTKLTTYRGKGSLRAWLFGIAANQCAQAFRDRERRNRILQEHVEEIWKEVQAIPAQPSLPEHTIAIQRQLARYDEALMQLPSDQRAVVLLHRVRELSIREIAQTLGERTNKVRALLRRAERQIERMTEAENDSE